jgi:IS4 transposase
VIRFKTNLELFHKKFLRRFQAEDSSVIADFTCHLGTSQNRSKHRHRVKFIDNEGNVICVVNNLRNVSAETIAKMYQARWKIEMFFGWINKT